MIISLRWAALKQNRWYQYVMRFALGGAATALTGLIAKLYGPETGGLFLAFPAIFAASATLVETHERGRKEKRGLKGARRGQQAAALDAAGAAIGSFGLMAFGAAFWLLAEPWRWWVLPAAFLAWTVVCFLGWWVWFCRCGNPLA